MIEQVKSDQVRCAVFGECGGCAYQDLPYEEELALKQRGLEALFAQTLGLGPEVFDAIVASPQDYHYRSRMDLTIRRIKTGEILVGFQSPNSRRMVQVEACPIARREISDFIPTLRKVAGERLPANYRIANLTLRTGDDGRVCWGGMGRRSLQMDEADYLRTDIHGKRIYYSLDTFFQSNLGILPALMDKVGELASFDPTVHFFDLYAGVGLFGLYFADRVGGVTFIESSETSVRLLKYNLKTRGLDFQTPGLKRVFEIRSGRLEEELGAALAGREKTRKIAMVDPSRKGLSPGVCLKLAQTKSFERLFYLSCNPQALARDLQTFLKSGWTVKRVVPFDFFPQTQHLEVFVLLEP